MNLIQLSNRISAILLLAIVVSGNVFGAESFAIVRIAQGKVTDEKGQKLIVGQKLGNCATILVGEASRAYLFLGDNGPFLKLREHTVLHIEELQNNGKAGTEKTVRTRLELRQGVVEGLVRKLGQSSLYMIKTPNAELTVDQGGEFEFSASGNLQCAYGPLKLDVTDQRIAVPSKMSYNAQSKKLAPSEYQMQEFRIICRLPSPPPPLNWRRKF